jgi:hypothetical protein
MIITASVSLFRLEILPSLPKPKYPNLSDGPADEPAHEFHAGTAFLRNDRLAVG